MISRYYLLQGQRLNAPTWLVLQGVA